MGLDVDSNSFAIHRAVVRDGTELAYVREGTGGVPVLLLHGWPATKRIFYRNIEALAQAGFEVIAPDASGWGDSPVPAGGRYADFTSAAHDFVALMEQLGHKRFVLAAFDFGSVSALHMVNRFPQAIIRLMLWNAAVPNLPEEYQRHGLGGNVVAENEEISHHIRDHGADTDGFVTRFESDQARIDYVKGFYLGRIWKEGGPLISTSHVGNFDDAAATFQAEPFGNAESFRASLTYYAAFFHPELCYERPLLDQRITTETMFLFGVADELMGLKSTRRAEVAFDNLTGPFLIDRAGHFLSWERPHIWNRALIGFCRDLLVR